MKTVTPARLAAAAILLIVYFVVWVSFQPHAPTDAQILSQLTTHGAAPPQDTTMSRLSTTGWVITLIASALIVFSGELRNLFTKDENNYDEFDND